MKVQNTILIKVCFILIFVINILIIYFIANTFTAYATPSEEDGQKIILIDPGHGGMDGGAVSKRGTIEKNINLSVCLKLKNKLENCGYTILMTREADVSLNGVNGSVKEKKHQDLNARCKIKRESNCDIFISIHQNFFPEPQYYGAQVWYSKCEQSKMLAHIIQKNIRKDINNLNKREEKPAYNDYKVLSCYYNIPSVLVECGFLSNFREDIQLNDDTYQQIVADSIVESVKEYFEFYKSCSIN